MEMFGGHLVHVGSSADFDTETWTASMWLWVDEGVTNWRTTFGSWHGGAFALHIGMNVGGEWGDHGGGETSGTQQITRGRWYHVVSVRTPAGAENSLWVNGVKQAQISTGQPRTPGSSGLMKTWPFGEIGGNSY